jgi:hypothetical protein
MTKIPMPPFEMTSLDLYFLFTRLIVNIMMRARDTSSQLIPTHRSNDRIL